jgi:hypothetical protein
MGIFSAKLRVWNPATSTPAEELEVMVDTGASYVGFCELGLS